MASKPSYEALEKQVQALEKALLEQETVLDHLPDLVVIQDLNHQIVWANQAACQFLGRDRQELRKARCHELWNFRAEPCADCPLPRCLENGGVETAERTTPDGRTWRIRCTPLLDEQGEISRILQVREDITETVRLRKAHERAKRHRELILETMQEVLVFYDTDRRLKWANRAATDFAGDTAENLLGRKCHELWHQSDTPCEDCPALQAMESGQPREIERALPDGRFYRLCGYPVYDGNGKLIGTVEYGFDITEIKRTQLELAEYCKRYQVLFESANDAIFVACAQTGIVLDANQKAQSLTGRSKSEIIGMHQSELHPPEQAKAAKTNFQNDAENRGKPVYHDRDLLDKQGRKLAVEISASLIEMEGRPCILGIFRDVSEQRKAEEVLRQYEALVNAVTDPASYVDRRYIYRIVSEAYTQNYCKPKEAIIGHPVWELMGEKPFETIIRPHLDLCFAGETVSYSSWFSFPDGSRRYMETCYYPVFDASGETVIGASVFARDHTARKMAEDALRQSEARFRAIFQNEYVVMLIIDSDTGAIWDANPAAVNYYGWSYEQLTGMNIKQINTLRPEAVVKEMRKAYQKKRKYFNFRHRLKDGTVRDVEVSSGPVEFGGQTFLFSIVRDVTERKQAEKALKESETRYRAVFDQAAVGITVASPDGRILESNAALCEMLGYTLEELLGLTVYDINYSEDMQRQRVLIQEVLDGKRDTFHIEKRFLHKSGHLVWVHHSSNVVRNESGAVEFAIGASVDISERKRAETALAESEARFRAIFEQASAGIAVAVMPSTQIVEANQAFSDMLGYSGEELRRLTVADITWPADLELQRAHERPILENQQDTFNLEKRFLHKNGQPVWANLSSTVVRDEDGEIRYAIGVVVDITERKRAEAALAESEKRFRLLAEYMPVLVNASTKDAVFTFWNKTCEAVTGYRKEEIIGNPDAMDLMYPNLDYHQQLVSKWERSGWVVRNEEFVLRAKDGSYRHILWSNLPPEMSFTGNDSWAVGVDITERKRAETALQNALAEKEVLLREIHHRVKNNMQVIISLLRMHSRRTEDPNLKRIFNECRDRIDAMSLIHQILYQSEDLDRIELGGYLKKLCANLRRAYATAGKAVCVTVDQCDLSLAMDQGIAVGMVVSELIANAFKHAFPGEEKGSVSVHLDCPDGQTVELIVEDDGIGLPPEVDVFNTRSIGLRLVSGAVTRDLGGTLTVENHGGTRFIIRFQCQPPTT